MKKRQKCPACKKNKLTKGQILCDECFKGQDEGLIASKEDADKIVKTAIYNANKSMKFMPTEDCLTSMSTVERKEIENIIDKKLPKGLRSFCVELALIGANDFKFSTPYGSITWKNIVNEEIEEPLHGHPEFYKILEEMKQIHSSKNHDYAGKKDPLANLKMIENYTSLPAWKGAIVRLTDKMSRLLTFFDQEELLVKDESIEDTFKDDAIYAILGLILYREWKNKQKEKK